VYVEQDWTGAGNKWGRKWKVRGQRRKEGGEVILENNLKCASATEA